MNVIEVPIDQIKPYENNPRINDDAVQETANSIKEFGFQQPIVVDKNNVVIVGHTRLKAAKKLKLKKVPVVIADRLSDEQVKAYRLADNKTGELAEWDVRLLQIELDDILNLDMDSFGFETQIEFDPLNEEIPSIDEPKKEEYFEIKCKSCGEVMKIDNQGRICD